MTAIGYTRVSTDEQTESGLSLANQTAKVRALADLRDMDLDDVITDAGASAGSMNREGLRALLGRVRARKVDTVVIFKLDRLTRNQRDLLDLLAMFQRYGVALISVSEQLDTDSATGRFFVQMLGAIAEWERGIISERTSAALNQLRTEGRRFCGIPPYGFGFDDAGNMVEVETEQATLAVIRDLFEEGFSLRRVGTELERRGHKPRTGGRWSPSLIARLRKAA